MSAEFDATEYFVRRAQTAVAQENAQPAQGKLLDLVAAGDRARVSLQQDLVVTKQKELAKLNSWVGKLGVDETSVTADTVNLGASVYSGISRVAGDMAGFVGGDLEAIVRDASLSNEQIAAIGRYKQGKATPGDQVLINTRKREGAQSPLEMFDKAAEARTRGLNIGEAFDRSDAVHLGNRDALHDQLGENFQGAWDQTKAGAKAIWDGDLAGSGDAVAGMAKLIFNAGEAAVDNPMAALEYIAENVPQLAIGAAGAPGKAALLTSNAGYASENYQKGIAKYQAENGGAYPPVEMRQKMAAYAASTALAEQIMDTSLLKGIGGAAKSVEDTARTGFLQSMKNIGRVGAGGTAGEAVTEGWQTFAEGEASLTPVSAQDIYEGATIGGIAGGGMAAGGRAAGEILKVTPEHLKNQRITQATEQTRNEAQAAAIASGDVSALVDPKGSLYDPSRAIAALAGNSALPDTTPEAKQTNLTKAGEIVAELEKQKAKVDSNIEGLLDGMNVEAIKTRLEQAKAQKDKPAVEMLAGLLKDEALLQKEKAKLGDRILKANEYLARFNQELTGTAPAASTTPEVDVAAQVAAINTPVDETDATAVATRRVEADQVITLSMAMPDRLDPKVAAAMADNPANGLSAPQREYLRTFSAARVAENTLLKMDDVSNRVFTGQGRDVGISQYRRWFAAAVGANNQGLATQHLTALQNFAQDHAAKAKVAGEALAQFQATGAPVEFLSDGKRGWSISKGQHLSQKDRTTNGGWLIHRGTKPERITQIQLEAQAVTAAAAELKAAYALKFNQTNPTQGAANVPVVPQAPAPAQGAAVANQAGQAPGAAGATVVAPGATPVQPAAGAAAGTTGVEPARVDAVKTLITEVEGRITQLQAGLSSSQRNNDPRGAASFEKQIAEAKADIAQLTGLIGGKSDLKKAVQLLTARLRKGADGQSHKIMQELRLVAPEIYAQVRAAKADGGTLYITGAAAITKILGELRAQEKIDFIDAEVETLVKNDGVPRDVAQKVADLRAENRGLQESMVGRPETGADAEAAIGAKKARIVANDSRIATLLTPRPRTTAEPTTTQEISSTQAPVGAVVSDERSEGQNQSTESTDSKPIEKVESHNPEESAEQTSAPVQGLTVLRKGKVAPQPEGTPLGSIYRAINKAVTFLTQKQSKVEKDDDIRTVRPLVDVQGFLTAWNADKTLPESFFPGLEFSDAQETALRVFKDYANKWSEMVRKNFIPGSLPNSKGKKKSADQLFRDPVQDFFNEDGTLDENIVTAVIYAGYSWLIDSTMAPALMKKDAVLEMHGLEPGDHIDTVGFKTLNRMNSFEDIAINSMGARVVSVLGLKAKPGAPQDYLAKVATAFGVHAMQMLKREGLVELHTVPMRDMAAWMPDLGLDTSSPSADRQYYSYIKIVRDDETFKTIGDGKTITESIVKSGSVLNKMFDAEHVPMEASTEQIPFKQQFAKRTKQRVSRKQKAILKEAQKQENRIIPDMWNALQVLGGSVILKAAGWKDLESSGIQANNYDAVEAQNNNLENQLQGMVDLIDPTNLKQAFYANFEVWKNFRVGVSTRNMNLQTSKIHRFMFFRPSWESTIQLKDQAKVDSFLVAVGQALGVKVDQQPNVETLVKLENRLTGEGDRTRELARLLNKAITDPETNKLTPEQKEAIGNLSAGAEGMQTLQALVAYGKYLAAVDAKVESFTATMLVGVDGKTNGPILSHLALGAAATVDSMFAMMNRGGMYSVESGIKHFSAWYKETTSLDLYEDLARAILTSFSFNTPGLKSIQVITKDLLTAERKVTSAGRKLVKTPLTSFAFGSTIKKSLQNMQDAFVQGVFDRIEDLATGADPRLKRVELINAINEMFTMGGLGRDELIPLDAPVERLMAWKIKPKQYAALTSAFNDVLGKPVDKTMRQYFGVFIQRRDAVNKAIQSSFHIYNAIYKDLRKKEMERLMEAGEIDYDSISQRDEEGKLDPSKPKIKVPLHDLTVGQEEALRKTVESVLPQAHTAYTHGTGALDAGLMMSKRSGGLGTDPMHEVEVQMGIPFTGPNGKQSIQVLSKSMQEGEVSPGVAGLPYLMHSTDSHIMHDEIGDDLNVHDEAANAAHKVEQTAKRINGSTWKTMLRFSPATEAFEMLERSIMNAMKMIEAGDVSPEALRAIEMTLNDMLTKQQRKEGVPIEQLATLALSNAKGQQYEAEGVRLETMSVMGVIDQYTWEGGQYEVTKEDRDEASAMLAEHKEQGNRLKPETVDAARALGQALKKAFTKAPAAQETKLESDGVEEKTSPFGALGTPTIESDPGLVKFFEANPTTTVSALAQHLYSRMRTGQGRMNEFNKELLKELFKTVGKGLTIKYVTPETAEADVMAKAVGASRGWFVSMQDGKETIYVLSPAFVDSGLTTELLMHELTHGAVARTVARELAALKADPKHTSPTLDLINELEVLRGKATDYAKEKGITGFDAALADIQEFIAWGMTSQGFQRTVLSQVTMQTKTGKNPLVTGMKDFISKVVGILFAGSDKSKQAQYVNGLTVMLKNVSGLMEASQQNKAGPAAGAALNLSMANPLGATQTYTTLDIHAALNAGSVTPAFSDQLVGLLGGIVQKLHGPFGTFKAALMENQALTPFDVWQKALATGVAAFAESSQASPLAVGAQEAFVMDQVEATVRAALDGTGVTSGSTYRELVRLFAEAKEKIKPSDFASQAEYDFIFKVEVGADNKSHHLARFAAFGLAHEGFNKMLRVATDVRRQKGNKTFAERLQVLFEDILEYFDETLSKTFGGQRADTKLTLLVNQLIDIEAKQRVMLAAPEGAGAMAFIEKGIKSAGETVRSKVVDVAGSDFFTKANSPIVRAAGSLAKTVAADQVEGFMKAIVDFRNKQNDEKHGLAMGLLSDIRGPGKVINALLLAANGIQRMRKSIISGTSKVVLNAFANEGKDLTKEAKKAITQVFLRTGAHVLLGTGRMNMAQLADVVGNVTVRESTIAGLEAQLAGFGPYQFHFRNQANYLGYFRSTGETRHQKLMMNAHNIARLYGTGETSTLTEAQSQQAEAIIEQLVALYGLRYARGQSLVEAKELLRTEAARTDGKNGIEFVLQLHKKLEQESKARLFQGQEALMMHGFTPDITNPHVEVLTANVVGGKELELRGYKKIGPVERDAADPDVEPKSLYVLRGAGLMSRLSGVMSFTGMNTKGNTKHNGYMNIYTADGLQNAIDQAAISNAKAGSLDTAVMGDPSLVKSTFMAPVVNPKGEIVNWRYLMKDKTKDAINALERDNRFERVLGMLAGSIYDKETTTDQNTKVIQALHDLNDGERFVNPEAFLMVGPKSPDPELREIWRLLPHDTQAAVRRIWKMDGLYVRREELTVIFGYRKASLTDAVRKTEARRRSDEDRAALGQLPLPKEWDDVVAGLFTGVVEGMLETSFLLRHPTKSKQEAEKYAKRAAVVVSRSERIWQDLVHEVKDILVVKTGVVMLGNIYSNLSFLVLAGVPVKDILVTSLVALRGARAYTSDTEKLRELQAQIDTGLTQGNDASIRTEIARLKDALQRNPVREQIEAGLMPTIVEDVAQDDDPYSYKSALVQKVEENTGWVNDSVKSTARTVYMAHDTKMYQGLSRITQLSDFVARYTLYQHLTTRKTNPLTKEDAIFEASETFINYDIPLPKGMQYLDDMGITMFTKYFIRVQRVLLKLVRDNPARVLMTVALGNFMDLGPIVLEGSALTRVGNNPFGVGPLNLPGTLDELATVNAAMSLIK